MESGTAARQNYSVQSCAEGGKVVKADEKTSVRQTEKGKEGGEKECVCESERESSGRKESDEEEIRADRG